MTTLFPGALDAFTNITDPNTPTKVPVGGRKHSEFHNDYNDSIEALQAKVGVTNSADPTSLDNKVTKGVPSDIQKQSYSYATATGAVNTYAITLSPVPTAYTIGMRISFLSNLANTATATVNVNGLGAKTLKKLGGTTSLVAGDITINQIVDAVYNGTDFEVQTPTIQPPAVSILSQPGAYATDTGAANAYVITLSPVPVAYALGQRVSLRALNANTGASTINVNGLGIRNISQQNGQALEAGMILVNQMTDLEYDGTVFQLVSNTGSRSRYVNALPASAVTSSTTEGTVLSTTILAGTMGTNRAVRITGSYEVTLGLVATCTLRVKFGGTTILTLTADSSNLATLNPVSVGRFEAVIINTSASAQQGRATIDGTWGGTVSSVDIHRSKRASGTSAINTASNVTLDVTTQSSNASISMTVYGILVELVS